MSTQLARGPRATAGPASTSTRQQLDELDALLQRMLQLPVQQGEDEPEQEARFVDLPQEDVSRTAAPRIEMRASEPGPAATATSRQAQPQPTEPRQRSYPPSYMVVETNNPAYLTRRLSTDEPPRDAGLGPKMITADQPDADATVEMPVPGGRHDLEADDPVHPAEDLARLQAELGTPPEEWVPFHSSWQPSEQTWKPLADSWQQGRVGPNSGPAAIPETAKTEPSHEVTPTESSRPKLRDLPRATVPIPPPVAKTQFPPPPPPPVPTARSPIAPGEPASARIIKPLVWFNSAFDVLLLPLGPTGKWLESKRGGSFLATLGLIFLVGAAALAVADGIGWTR